MSAQTLVIESVMQMRLQWAMASERKSVKLDLYIDEDDTLRTAEDETVDEVLCLRILSSKTKYRFGGLKIHVESPIFAIGKVFNVEFDEDSEVALIKGQEDAILEKSSLANAAAVSAVEPCKKAPNEKMTKAATIVISPDKNEDLQNSPTVSADLTLLEVTDNGKATTAPFARKFSLDAKSGCKISDPNSSEGRQSSQQLKKFMSKKLQSTWHGAVRVKRFFADSLLSLN